MNTPARSQARSTARLAAVQALYQQQMENTPLAKLLDEFHQHRLGKVIDEDEFADAEVEFFDDLVRGVDARREEIDALLVSKLADGWTLARLDKTMDCGTTRYCIANNFDQQFHKHSPGRVLLYDDFTSAAARGITHLDWGLGDGGYKRQMGAEEGSSVSDLLFVRNPLLAALLRPVWER